MPYLGYQNGLELISRLGTATKYPQQSLDQKLVTNDRSGPTHTNANGLHGHIAGIAGAARSTTVTTGGLAFLTETVTGIDSGGQHKQDRTQHAHDPQIAQTHFSGSLFNRLKL